MKIQWLPIPECHSDHRAVQQPRGAAFARHLTKAAFFGKLQSGVLYHLIVLFGEDIRIMELAAKAIKPIKIDFKWRKISIFAL